VPAAFRDDRGVDDIELSQGKRLPPVRRVRRSRRYCWLLRLVAGRDSESDDCERDASSASAHESPRQLLDDAIDVEAPFPVPELVYDVTDRGDEREAAQP
jgi:hypothetical protein